MIFEQDPKGAPATHTPPSHSLGDALEREAQLYLSQRNDDGERPAQTFLVADLEFRWNRPLFDAYLVAEGCDARSKPLWPFDLIGAASWLVLRFRAGEAIPEIEPIVVMAEDEASDREMVERLFDALSADPHTVFVSWGGEVRDLAVLRRYAATLGLLLPPQLRDGSPNARSRIDLCRAVTVQAKPVHLPELATAVSIPTKPSPSKTIGKLVEASKWREVRDQVLADVLTTSVLLVRHLLSHCQVTCNRTDTMVAIADAAALGAPASEFVKRQFAPWAKAGRIRAQLPGLIRAPV